MNRILVTGGSGFLGSRIRYYYGETGKKKVNVFAPTRQEMDFTRPASVRDYLLNCKPEVVFHCGGIADTEYVRTYPKEGYRINVEGTCNLALLTGEMGIPLVFTSSDYVYQGKTIAGKNYDEQVDGFREEEANPGEEYGIQKLEAEKKCLKANPQAVALRLTWMYDIPREGLVNKDNFLTNLLAARETRTPLKFARYEYRGLTNVWQVVENMEKASQLPAGSYNFGCTNSLSTIEVAEMVGHLLGISPDMLIEDRQRFADRPRNITMSEEKLKKQGISFGSTIDGLRRFVEQEF